MLNCQKSFVLAFAVAAFTGSAFAQNFELPRQSPFAKVQQTAGLTEITVDYSSPAVRGRAIWGALVPYAKVWRTGANLATKVTFSKDVTIGTTAVPAGSYALFAIPNAASWTMIINKDFQQGGAFNYKQELDVVRVEVKPETIANREHLAYLIEDFDNNSASLDLEWEKVKVRLPIKLGTEAQVVAGLKGMEESLGGPTTQVARYFLEQKKDYDQGIVWVDRSIKIKEDWFNTWTKAQLLAAKGNTKEAYALAVKAQAMGEKAPPGRFFFADEVKKATVDWKPAGGAPAKKK